MAEAGLIDQLFARFGQHLEAAGYIARGGQIIDATLVSVRMLRNAKEENAAIKAGKTPQGWEKQPAKNAQKCLISCRVTNEFLVWRRRAQEHAHRHYPAAQHGN